MAAQVKSVFEGKWKVDRSDNFEAFLDAMGVGFMKKKMALSLTPTLDISVEGDTIIVTMTVGPKSEKNSFKLREQYEIKGEMSGTAVTTLSDGKLSSAMTPSKGKNSTIVREVVNGELLQTMTVEGVTAIRYFKRV